MSAHEQIERYVAGGGERVRRLLRLQSAAAAAAAAALVSVLVVSVAQALPLSPALWWLARGGVLAAAALAAWVGGLAALRRLDARAVCRRIEAQVPALDGRLLAFCDAGVLPAPSQVAGTAAAPVPAAPPRAAGAAVARRWLRRLAQGAGRWSPGIARRLRALQPLPPSRLPAAKSALLPLLASEVAAALAARPVDAVIAARSWRAPALLLAAALATLVLLLAAAPERFRHAAATLFAGWLPAAVGALEVTPGSVRVARGSDVLVRVRGAGAAAELQVLGPQAADGTAAPMRDRGGGAFEFVVVGVREPFDYFVRSGAAQSPRYRVDVVDLPAADAVELTLRPPAWTRRPPQVTASREVRALPDTVVEVAVRSSAAAGALLLVVDHGDAAPVERVPLRGDGPLHRGAFSVRAHGSWRLATRLDDALGDEVAMTRDYAVRLLADAAPRLHVVRPARDWSATRIEEVVVRVDVRDDHAVEGVRLDYRVNGGAVRSADIPVAAVAPAAVAAPGDVPAAAGVVAPDAAGAAGTPGPAGVTAPGAGPASVLAGAVASEASAAPPAGTTTEPAAVTAPPGTASVDVLPPAADRAPADPGATTGADAAVRGTYVLRLEDLRSDTGEPLAPGDLVAWSVSARDRAQETRSEIWFIDVRPFSRTYRDSQQQSRGGGGGGGGFDAAARAREIVSAIWNLTRARADATKTDAEIADHARRLAGLAEALAQQTTVLADRAEGRGLDAEAGYRQFIEHLRAAAAALATTGEQLAAADLEAALPPAQQALRSLLAAEATVGEVSVSLGDAGGGGGGGASSLGELIEVEMDTARNRYETEQALAEDGGGEAGGLDDAWRELEALARRQQQLAAESAARARTPESRWQQERLQRELEQVRERLAQARAAGGGAARGDGGALDTALREIEQAQAALERGATPGERPRPAGTVADAAAAAMPGAEATADATATAAAEALERAAAALRAREQAAIEQSVAGIADDAAALAGEQRAAMQALAQLLNGNADLFDPVRRGAEVDLALRKRAMVEALERLARGVEAAAAGTRTSRPGLSRALDDALSGLREARVGERLAVAEEAILAGAGGYVADSEPEVTRALDRFARGLAQAREAAAAGSGQESMPLDVALARLAALRATLSGGGAAAAGGLADVEAALSALQVDIGSAALLRPGVDAGALAALRAAVQRSPELGRAADASALRAALAGRVDALELSLRGLATGSAAVSQGEPRPAGADDAAVAEYFRRLGDVAPAAATPGAAR
jgi:hypothetical protein